MKRASLEGYRLLFVDVITIRFLSIRSRRVLSRGMCALLLLVVSRSSWSQDDPFRDSGAAAASPAATTAIDTGDAKDAADKETSEYEKLLAAEKDPLVRAILDAKPTKPDQWIHDVQALLNLNRPVFAKEYLKQFSALKPDDAELARIESRYGTALFLRLATTPQLQPEGAAVADAVTQAAHARMQDGARLAALVDRLSDADRAVARSALVELVKAGSVAAVPMITVLADDNRKEAHVAVSTALAALGNEAVDPLIAALGSSNQVLRAQVIAILDKIKSLRATPFVLATALAPQGGVDPRVQRAATKMLRDTLGDVPSRDEATQFLTRQLDEFLAGSPPGPVDQNDHVTVWIWDASQQIPRQQETAAEDASFVAAALAAEQLHALNATDSEFKQMYLATGLEVAKRLNGYNRPLTQEIGAIYRHAESANTAHLEQVLELALKRKMQGAAIAIIDLLSARKDSELLHSADGKPRLLARALLSPMPRVKFAAAQAVMNIDPTHAYPGSSYLPEVLAYLSASGGVRRVLIGNPRQADAQQLAGFYNVLGFVVDSRTTGRAFALQAFTDPDYRFLLIHDAIDHPRYRELIQTLRRDPRTADLPVGVIVREENQESAEWFAKTDPLTITLAPAVTQEDAALDARRLLALAGRKLVSPDERIHQALFALDALARLATEPEKYRIYDLLPLDERMEQALSVPELAVKAAGVLGLLATPRAQRALVAMANTQIRPIAQRQAAAAAFRTAVSRHGLLLTRDQLAQQYKIYNNSEFLDRDTQQVLASILDAIEAPSRAADAAAKQD